MTRRAEVPAQPSQEEMREETFTLEFVLAQSEPFWLDQGNPGSWFMVFKLLDLFLDKEPNCWLFDEGIWLGGESFLAIPIW